MHSTYPCTRSGLLNKLTAMDYDNFVIEKHHTPLEHFLVSEFNPIPPLFIVKTFP